MYGRTLARAARLVVAACLLLVALPAALHAADAAPRAAAVAKGPCPDCGGVTGLVLQAGTADPVPNAQVTVFDPNGLPVAVAATLADGSFDTGATVPAGTYRAQVLHPTHLTMLYGDVVCPISSCDLTNGAPITVTSGGSTAANFTLRVGARLGGQITGPVGVTLVGSVRVVKSDDSDQLVVPIAPDGSWNTGTIVPAGSYRVHTLNESGLIDEAWPAGICTRWDCIGQGQSFSVTEGEVSNGIDVTLEAGGTIRGEVTQGGAPVESALVRFVSADGTHERFAFTGVDGSYDSRTGLVPGVWHALVDPGIDRLGEVWQELPCLLCIATNGAPIVVAASTASADIDFTLQSGGRIGGRILSAVDNSPLPGASVEIYSLERGLVELQFAVDVDGSYLTAPLPPGNYTVAAIAPGHEFQVLGASGCPDCEHADGTPQVVSEGATLTGIDVTLPLGAGVAGRVTDPEGNGIANVFVVIENETHTYFSDPSDANGDYVVPNAAPGTYAALALSSGHLMTTGWPDVPCVVQCVLAALPQFELVVGPVRDDIDITMQRGGVLEGHVTAAVGGAPLEDVRVNLLPITDDTVTATIATTDPSGYYRTEALPVGSYYALTQDSQGYIAEAYDNVRCFNGCDNAALTPRVLTPGSTAVADFALDLGGRISGRVSRASDDQPLGNPRPLVQFLDASGIIVDGATVATSANYLSAGLPPGTYYVRSRNRTGFLDELFDDESCFWCVPPPGNAVAVVAGAVTASVDFALVPGARLGGTVTEEDGGGAASLLLVDVHDANGLFVTSATIGAGGAWRTTNAVAPGTYYLSTRSSGRYRDESYGGQVCSGTCAPPAGAAVTVVGTTDVNGLDFALAHLPVFRDGFE
jgi:hypothetical protein